MLSLGITGYPKARLRYLMPPNILSEQDCGDQHDAAAAIVKDGRVLVAAEEERFTRNKFDGRFPYHAIAYCLAELELDITAVDHICFGETGAQDPANPEYSTPSLCEEDIAELLCAEFGQQKLPPIHLTPHHESHASASHALSGFGDSLIVSYDGHGDLISTAVWKAHNSVLEKLVSLPPIRGSLGFLYSEPLATLGYGYGDDYKVMGLAPYGNAETFRSLFNSCIELQSEGRFDLDLNRLREGIQSRVAPPKTAGVFESIHQDLAAATQAAFETCSMHLLTHYQSVTRLRQLCIGGGCGQNTVFNGRLAKETLFDKVFIMPGCTDASLAVGAAFMPWRAAGHTLTPHAIKHCYWGPSVPTREALESELAPWAAVLDIECKEDIVGEAAAHLAEGGTMGWMQGRMEFGPRALGNRSILADPRPAENKDVINALIKNRESYRPFAVSIREDALSDFLEDTEVVTSKSFMTSTAQVREQCRQQLGAVTHVNGSVRMQTVSEQQNPRYHELLTRFGEQTGVPALLNTSFNSNGEPIVNTPAQAITCMLTSGLSDLIIGDYWLRKQADWEDRIVDLKPYLPPTSQVSLGDVGEPPIRKGKLQYFISNGIQHFVLKREHALLLCEADGDTSIAGIIERLGLQDLSTQILATLTKLWGRRLILLKP